MKIKFCLNKNLDRQMISEFININDGGGIDFAKGIIKTHPKLKKIIPSSNKLSTNDKKIYLQEYVNFYYNKNKSPMLQKIDLIKKAWKTKETVYVDTTKDFFDNFDFSKNDYTAYASIINCNPRFLESKTFQFFYRKSESDAIHTIAHEILHFIFFDFIKKKMKKEIKDLSEDQLWDLSEIFNVVLLGSNRYKGVVDKKLVIAYPDHQHYIPTFKKAYKNSNNAKEFIEQGILIILNKK
ncbi:MAG: hypothetical protein WAV16_03670 [Candidatus Moraniibacteriota bacterium]